MPEINAANAGTITLGGETTVNRLGLGTNRSAGNDASRAVLRRAVELGVTFIDTAEMYHQSEEVIGATLAPHPLGVVVATKGGVTPQFQPGNDPATIRRGVDQRLRRLRLAAAQLDETSGSLKELRDAGLIRHVTLSDVTIEHIECAREGAEDLEGGPFNAAHLGRGHKVGVKRTGGETGQLGRGALDRLN